MGSLPVVSEVLPANLNRAFLQGSAYNRIAFFLTYALVSKKTGNNNTASGFRALSTTQPQVTIPLPGTGLPFSTRPQQQQRLGGLRTAIERARAQNLARP
jgi:hypothetical protein